MDTEIKPFWGKYFGFDWKFGLFLILIICIPRFIMVLNASVTKNYNYIALIMLVSAAASFVFLTKYGRKKIGMTRPKRFYRLIISLVIGVLFSFLLYVVGKALYGNTDSNWYEYIGKSYKLPAELSSQDKLIYFVIFAVTSMTFSPIGEELFFRGIVHGSFAESLGEQKASIIDSLTFALIHIAHFGLIFSNGAWLFLTIPSLIWVGSMFLVSILFFISKKYSGSILGAVMCHSGFNLGMTYCIFYLL